MISLRPRAPEDGLQTLASIQRAEEVDVAFIDAKVEAGSDVRVIRHIPRLIERTLQHSAILIAPNSLRTQALQRKGSLWAAVFSRTHRIDLPQRARAYVPMDSIPAQEAVFQVDP